MRPSDIATTNAGGRGEGRMKNDSLFRLPWNLGIRGNLVHSKMRDFSTFQPWVWNGWVMTKELIRINYMYYIYTRKCVKVSTRKHLTLGANGVKERWLVFLVWSKRSCQRCHCRIHGNGHVSEAWVESSKAWNSEPAVMEWARQREGSNPKGTSWGEGERERENG